MATTTIITEGGLLPADILDAIAAGEVVGQRPEEFGLERGRNLTDEIAAAWQAARGQWQSFQFFLGRVREGESAASVTRERWALPLLAVLGYDPAYNQQAYLVEGRTYAISHRADKGEAAPPIHIEGARVSLDARPPSGRPRLSPHALVQEYLNSTEQLWGIVTNGERLRLLRDSSRFTRPAYVEFDLRAMFEGEQFSAFALLYRLLHRSRLPAGAGEGAASLLEQYHQRAVETGGRVREGLRDGVESALKILGDGLLRHPASAALRQRLARGLESGRDGDDSLTALGYYRQLLRLVYRLLFLMVAEERGLIAAEQDESDPLAPGQFRPSADRRLAIYAEHYSLARLRRLAEASGVGRGPYGDLWLSLLATFRLFEGSDELAPRRLGLAPLDGDLFGAHACAALTEGAGLSNAALLAAVRALSLYRDRESKALRRVNYGALDVEELGSVYESLLDYRPVVSLAGGSHREGQALPVNAPLFDLVSGTERKTTGSYYTRPELVQELIKSALVPVLEERLRAAGPAQAAREAAILAIRVVDPACGSGHFLLAAARRLGRELARVRAGEDQPSPAQFRRAVRDVIQRCIFGVDLNPLAVDLCKLALWIEGHSAGLPLSFLDHHIKRGNSLVGATRRLVEAGVPDEAYKPVTGDDKATASSIKKRNRQERELYLKQGLVQADMFAAAPAGPDLAGAMAALDAETDESVAAVRARAARYAKLRREADAERATFDLWTAAFFQPLTPANARYVPTSADLRGADPLSEKALMAAPLAEEVGFFHWELEFPQVFAGMKDEGGRMKPDSAAHPSSLIPHPSHGFDVVLGNPPWERIKLQEQEHFVDVAEIAGAANKAARDRAIAAWRNGDERQRARIALFDAAKYRAEAEKRFMTASERFPLTSFGDLNTYALFAEQVRTIVNKIGRSGIIVPTGIATDDTFKQFFADLNRMKQVVSLYDFENREGIFSEVHRSYKFCLLTIGKTDKPAEFVFFAGSVVQLAEEQRRFTLTADEVLLLNPNSQTSPVFRTRADAEFAKKTYQRVPVLRNEHNELDPWGVIFTRMFHMTDDSHLFQDNPNDGLLPMYEGKMVQAYDHRFSSFDKTRNDYTLFAGRDPDSVVRPEYYVSAGEVERRIARWPWRRKWFFGVRRVTRNTDERTIIGSFLPLFAVTYGLHLTFSDSLSTKYACFAATLNSLTCDCFCRMSSSQPSLTHSVLYQLPVLPPDRFSAADIAFIVPRVVELVYTAWDIRAFAEDVWAEGDEGLRAELLRRNAECNAGADPALFSPRDGFPLPPYRWDEGRRAIARAELDARIARLYGLTRDELRYILDPADVYGPDFPGETFRVLKEKETRLYGEYRTRRLVLEAWDREEGGT